MIDALIGVLMIPAVAAAMLAALPGYRLTARINVLAPFLSFATAVSLFVVEPQSGTYLLVDDNIGLMWVAIDIATLTTVLMVGIYRTHEALEAAWKYFILGSVGIALALFGTILVYVTAQPVIGEGLDSMVWTVLIAHARALDPNLLDV